MKTYIIVALKGVAMGIANVIPGVSGGTIALITGIFERLINSIKSFNIKAIKLLFAGKIKEFWAHSDMNFLISLFAGIIIAVISIAKLFGYLFENYPIYIWAFFFGLVIASVYFVGKTINKWSIIVVITFIIGTAIAIIISILNPAKENNDFIYLLICGVAAICSMILPGLSGSFILILMGNYRLVMIDAINDRDWGILLPVVIGAGIGILAFSHFLSWIFKKFRDQTLATLTGFILGSLSVLWPWKSEIYLMDEAGNQILKRGEPVIVGYDKFIPESFNAEVFLVIALVIVGIVSIWAIEKAANVKGE